MANDPLELLAKALVAFFKSRDDVMARLNNLIAKYPDGVPPLSVLNILLEYTSEEAVKGWLKPVAESLAKLAQTGKSETTRDRSALA